MTTNLERVVNVIAGAGNCDFCEMLVDPGESCAYCTRSAETFAQALADAGLLMPDDMETQYGVWHKYPSEEEAISWEDNGKDLSGMAENMRKAGLKAERVARHVSPHRFITMSEEPK